MSPGRRPGKEPVARQNFIDLVTSSDNNSSNNEPSPRARRNTHNGAGPSRRANLRANTTNKNAAQPWPPPGTVQNRRTGVWILPSYRGTAGSEVLESPDLFPLIGRRLQPAELAALHRVSRTMRRLSTVSDPPPLDMFKTNLRQFKMDTVTLPRQPGQRYRTRIRFLRYLPSEAKYLHTTRDALISRIRARLASGRVHSDDVAHRIDDLYAGLKFYRMQNPASVPAYVFRRFMRARRATFRGLRGLTDELLAQLDKATLYMLAWAVGARLDKPRQ